MKLLWRSIWFNCVAFSFLAAAAFCLLFIWGKSQDCRPHQVDGQCGLATFGGLLAGMYAAGFLLLVCLVRVIGLLVLRWRQRSNRT